MGIDFQKRHFRDRKIKKRGLYRQEIKQIEHYKDKTFHERHNLSKTRIYINIGYFIKREDFS